MFLFMILTLGLGGVFLILGAWPIFGFFGLDLLLFYWAFRVNYRNGQIYETIQLTPNRLVVRYFQIDGTATKEWVFQPYWLQIRIDRQKNQLQLRSHGRSLTVGSFLTSPERETLAKALQEALRGLSNREPHLS